MVQEKEKPVIFIKNDLPSLVELAKKLKEDEVSKKDKCEDCEKEKELVDGLCKACIVEFHGA